MAYLGELVAPGADDLLTLAELPSRAVVWVGSYDLVGVQVQGVAF